MNQTDSKRVLAIFVGALSTLCIETCPENHFKLPDSLCCYKCPEGMYVTKNCSEAAGVHFGVSCGKCRRCEEFGQITVSNCTLFSDTQCEMGPPVPTHQQQIDGQLSQMTLYGCSVAVFMLAVIMAVCFFIRIRKSGESDKSSKGEPFKRHRDSLKKILI
ncbi:uncharacterized protein LOC127522648 isoform X2 [Ctenopharyngodon idella]|uniref:uncharacterized protein LOC127522648 isoform X1 n=1 Tax=Ctenopharyngodon idella TaxID=7959 RepID=UPI0022315C26|nr:uncharacterized protein LOC127522648 isoform X1 [Ctenopharyngodon idella]XP_051768767.1 uncharacterized protein LOC127522648 isoform X2 [Ctenopharyngodon idella]